MHAACVLPPPHRPSRLPARTSPPRIACPPFDSAVHVGLQPAAELRHLQRHDHVLHVRGALRACPWPPSLESGLFRACPLCAAHTTGPPASRLAPLPPRIACPPFDSTARVGLQPAAELRHLQRHDHALHVQRALSARALAPQALSRAFSVHATFVVPPPHPQALPPSGSHTSPHASHALPLTRQYASAFNQPLSFDTSSVTEMSYMFSVRSPRVPMAPKP